MKKLLIWVMVLSLVAPFVFASGSRDTSASSEPATSIKVWISSGAEDDVYKQLFDSIESETGVKINDEYYAKDELDQKLIVAPIVGDAPDMIIVDYLNIPSYYEAGLIEDLSPYIPDELLDDLIPSIKAESVYDGKWVSLAQFDAGMAMWANKSMLEDAGIRIPSSYHDAWTKEEFEDALAKLKANGVEYPLYIRQNNPSTLYYTYMPVIASFGGDYVNRDTMLTENVLNGENTVTAFEYITWLADNGYIDPNCDYENGFSSRKENALSLIGHWKYTEYVNGLGDDAIIVPIPDFGHGVFTCSGSVVISMTTSAKPNGTDELVWTVIEKMLSPEGIHTIVDFNGAIPSRISVLDSVPDLQEGGRLYIYREQLEGGISILRPLTPAHMTIYTAMQSAYGDIIHGTDAKTALTAASAEIDEIIIENGWNK